MDGSARLAAGRERCILNWGEEGQGTVAEEGPDNGTENRERDNLGEEREGTLEEGSVEASGQDSRLGGRSLAGSFLGVPQTESSRTEAEVVVDRSLGSIMEQGECLLPPPQDLNNTPEEQGVNYKEQGIDVDM